MSSGETIPDDRPLTPDDWPTEPEREFARKQTALADRHGVDIESRIVDTDVVGRVHYLTAGPADGDPLVLLHGINVPGATFIPMLPALTDEYRVYVPDRPARGLSATVDYRKHDLRPFMTAYLVEFFDGLGLEQPDIVASSLGGLQAFLLTLDHDRVDRLCLVGAPGGLSTDFSFFFRLNTAWGFNHFFNWLLSRGDPIENGKQRMEQFNVTDRSAIAEEFYELLAAHRQLPGRIESERTLSLSQGSWTRPHPLFDISDEIAGIERPTCFVWGTDDEFFPPEVGRPVAEQMPNAEFHELPDHGHTPWLEPDEQATAKIRAFFDG